MQIRDYLIPALYLVTMAGIFAGIASVSQMSPKLRATPIPASANTTNPAWERAGSNVAACCRIQAFERALPMLKSLKETNFDDLIFLGGFYRDWGKFPTAARYYERASQLAREQNDSARAGIALNNMALVKFSEGVTQTGAARAELFRSAETLYRQARELAQKGKHTALLATIERNYLALVEEEGQPHDAGKLSALN